MKRENFEKAEKLLKELDKVNNSLSEIEDLKNDWLHVLPLKSYKSFSETILYSNETTTNVLFQHYKLEKERIEKELEEL